MHERIFFSIDKARDNLSKKRGYKVTAEHPVCGLVCEDVARDLNKQIQDISIELPGTTHHLLLTRDNWIIDPQYKQFIPQDIRDELPDNLVINLNDKSENLPEILIGRGFDRQTALAYEVAVNKIKSSKISP